MDMRAEETIRKAAIGKYDNKIRKKIGSIANISVPNYRVMTSLKLFCWSLQTDLQDFICQSSGKLASSEVQESDLLPAKDVYKAFREQHLESDPPNIKFYDTMKKAKLKTFTDLNKKTKVKATYNQEVVL